MVKGVNAMGMEVCCTLGMLTEEQAAKLADAGLYAYNHNLDTSSEYYGEIITTRTYDDRLQTLENVRKAGVSVCCGGIIGLGETHEDRIKMLHTLSTLPEHPESVPVNALVPIAGTPLEHNEKVDVWDMVRMIATARILMPLMPKAMVRLSAGRTAMSTADQALCFMAGANSIFAGEKLLTTPNPSFEEDNAMFGLLGLTPREAFKEEKVLM
jgi:biotin synthase